MQHMVFHIYFIYYIGYMELASLIFHLVVAQEISFVQNRLCVCSFNNNYTCSILFSTNSFSGIPGIFGDELNTEYFVLDTFSENLLVHSHLCICANSEFIWFVNIGILYEDANTVVSSANDSKFKDV